MEAIARFDIMIVEDDEGIRNELAAALARWGLGSVFPDDFAAVSTAVAELKPALVILDINLPVFDGHEWCRRIRTFSKLPIMMISARDSGPDMVMGLSSGADDYVAKPFSVEVLTARVRALLRRSYEWGTDDSVRLVRADLILDLERCQACRGGQHRELTKNELLVLSCLMRAQGGVVSRDQLAAALWKDEVFVDDNTLTVNVSRLRQKLEELGLPEAIRTIKGRGYLLP